MINSELREGRIEASIFGKLVLDDFRELERQIETQISANQPLLLLIDLRTMAGFTLDAIIEDYRFSKRHADAGGKIAVLTESDFDSLIGWFEQSLVSAEIQLFDDETAARDWLAGTTEVPAELAE
ncbi:MAG: STAS/SEC14 domain-containing protein [Betaproteobacteria bacterium]|nr:STAS/SEC14 domain-containing protein [Betaproteobacteria bacterium]